MLGLYLLRDREVIPCDDLLTWAKGMADLNPVVGRDEIEGTLISTTFLGVASNWFGASVPLLFETMTFGDAIPNLQLRCATYAEAEIMHREVVALVRAFYEQSEQAAADALNRLQRSNLLNRGKDNKNDEGSKTDTRGTR